MNYRVTWVTFAQDAMLSIVFRRPDRAAIVNALNRLGATLEQEGPAAGESRDGRFRVLFELPLAVRFWVDERNREVIVTDVWAIG